MNGKVKIGLIIGGIVVAVLLMFFVLVQTQVNGAWSLEQQVASAQSDINVQEKRRTDLIPNLVECVKSYNKHEYETLKKVIAERGANADDVASMINAVAEAYPDLKADKQYRTLMNELSVTENFIAQYRQTYNNLVRDYNYYVHAFPHNIFLPLGGYKEQNYQYLNYEDASETAPSVDFGQE